jgi:hypothetical protein
MIHSLEKIARKQQITQEICYNVNSTIYVHYSIYNISTHLKRLSHVIDFKNFDKNLQNLA